jgi:hypothetical protein
MAVRLSALHAGKGESTERKKFDVLMAMKVQVSPFLDVTKISEERSVFYTQVRGNMFIRNACNDVPYHTTPHPRTQQYSKSI